MSKRQARQDEWLVEPLPADVRKALERLRRAPDVQRIVVLPDVHLAQQVCIGTVVATSNSFYPAAVGNDIGCGMAALAFDVRADLLDDPRTAARVLDGFSESIPILKHRERVPVPEELLSAPLSTPALEKTKDREASLQLGTLGRGNHFVELQSDEEGRLWAMVHTGSRSLGGTIRAFHEERGERVLGGLRRIAADSEAGRAYGRDMEWGLTFAQLNRERLLIQVAQVLERTLGAHPREDTQISCHHNFVRREHHQGVDLWVHRKGAVSAQAGEPGILPGSMGTASCHVMGQGESRSLCSSSHGAGRRMARGEARRQIRRYDLERQMQGVWFDRRLADKLRDEAPRAYKDLDAVLRAQRDLTRSVRRLRPRLVFKGT